MWWKQYTNTAENLALLQGGKQSALTIYKGFILDYDARNGPITDKIISKTWLIDMNKVNAAGPLAAAGEIEKANKLKDAAKSSLYKSYLKTYEIEKKRVDSAPFNAPGNTLGPLGAAAGDGNLLDTAYDKVRRVNYLKQISGKGYLMARFQARNVVNEVPTNDLNYKGFIDDNLLTGQPEIGDNQIPLPAKQQFDSFVKQIFADSFRFDLGTREQQDSQIDIGLRIRRQIPGIMEKMVNDKIVAILNALSGTDLADWDTYTNGIVDNDAAEGIEDLENSIEDYDGQRVLIAPRKVIRLYKRNTQGRNVTSVDSAEPEAGRSGTLPFNEHITYFVDNAVDANKLVLIAKDHFIDLYQGPQLNVAVKNEMTSNASVANILFNYNGVKKKVSGAAAQGNSVY